MSSAVSLVPTVQKTTKKRRPTFRPGGQRKKTKNASKSPATNNHNAVASVGTQDESAVLRESVKNNKGELPGTSSVVLSIAGQDNLSSNSSQQEPRAIQSSFKQTKKNSRTPTRKVTISEPVKCASNIESKVEKQPRKRRSKGIKVADKMSTPLNSRSKSTESLDQVLGKNQGKPASSGEPSKEEVVQPNSLASFCTKFIGPFRPRNKITESQPPPPPPPPTEEEAPSGPQVKVVNGEIVIQESSIMDPTTHKTVQEVEEEYEQVVEEEGQTGIIQTTYSSFTSRRKPQHWTVEDTRKFYNCLRQVGTDFVSMEAFFENRPRKSLKRKYQSEITRNPRLIELALDPRNKIAVDLSVFNVDKESIVVIPSNDNDISIAAPPSNKKDKDQNLPETQMVRRNKATIEKETHDDKQDDDVRDEPGQVEKEVEEVVKDPFNGIFPPANDKHHPRDDDIFGELGAMSEDNQIEEFTLEQEMSVDKPINDIPLQLVAPTKVKSKRPKFRAGKRKAK